MAQSYGGVSLITRWSSKFNLSQQESKNCANKILAQKSNGTENFQIDSGPRSLES